LKKGSERNSTNWPNALVEAAKLKEDELIAVKGFVYDWVDFPLIK
jgi:hypothetical protein